MNIQDLLSTDLQTNLSVSNDPFFYVGRAEITLDDGAKLFWFFSDDEGMLSIAPQEEELIIFEKIEDEIETSDTIFYRSKEYEFNYEDAGNVTSIDGDPLAEEEDRYMFSDYQAAGGEVLRVVLNENTGETLIYHGHTVSDEDVVTV